jgi:uncharacterized damage-inducible protein DinB
MKEATAPDPLKEGLKGQILAAFEFFERSTRNLSEEDSGFTLTPGTFTAAQQVAHTAQTIDWFMDGVFDPKGFSMDFEAAEKKVRSVTSLSEARAWLKRAVDNAVQVIDSRTAEEWAAPLAEGPVMGGQPRTSIFFGITDHTAHHRGSLAVYTRALGKTPPGPYMEPQ